MTRMTYSTTCPAGARDRSETGPIMPAATVVAHAVEDVVDQHAPWASAVPEIIRSFEIGPTTSGVVGIGWKPCRTSLARIAAKFLAQPQAVNYRMSLLPSRVKS